MAKRSAFTTASSAAGHAVTISKSPDAGSATPVSASRISAGAARTTSCERGSHSVPASARPAIVKIGAPNGATASIRTPPSRVRPTCSVPRTRRPSTRPDSLMSAVRLRSSPHEAIDAW